MLDYFLVIKTLYDRFKQFTPIAFFFGGFTWDSLTHRKRRRLAKRRRKGFCCASSPESFLEHVKSKSVCTGTRLLACHEIAFRTGRRHRQTGPSVLNRINENRQRDRGVFDSGKILPKRGGVIWHFLFNDAP